MCLALFVSISNIQKDFEIEERTLSHRIFNQSIKTVMTGNVLMLKRKLPPSLS